MEKEFCKHGTVFGACPSQEYENEYILWYHEETEQYKKDIGIKDERPSSEMGQGMAHYNDVMFG